MQQDVKKAGSTSSSRRCELVGEEAGDVVPNRVRERRRVRLEGLHDDPARRIPAAPAGQLRHELERPLLGAEVREREPRVRVDDRRDLDAREVVALRHHLRPDQHGRARRREALERIAQRARPRGGVRVEADPLEAGHSPRQLRVEALRPRTDARELDRAALGARGRHLGRVAAVVAVEPRVVVQCERDVAASAARVVPHARQWTAPERPRRLRRRIARPPRSSTAESSASSGADSG